MDGRLSLLKALLPGLQRIFQGWVEANFVAEEGCFFSSDTADGGEDSILGMAVEPLSMPSWWVEHCHVIMMTPN